jgi:outer membrane receptor protein involved in Fe transport
MSPASLPVLALFLSGPEPLTAADLLEAGLLGEAANAAVHEGSARCAAVADALPPREAHALLSACIDRDPTDEGLLKRRAHTRAALMPHAARADAAALSLLTADPSTAAEPLRAAGAPRAARAALLGAHDAASLRTRLALALDARAWDQARALGPALAASGTLDDDVRYALAFANVESSAYQDAEAWLAPITAPDWFERATSLRALIAERRASPQGALELAASSDPADTPAPAAQSPAAEVEVSREVLVRVTDAQGVPLVGVGIALRGGGPLGVTDKHGLLRAPLPAGPVTLSVVGAGFEPRILELDTFVSDAVTATLMPRWVELEEMVVRAPHLEGVDRSLTERREQKQLVEVIDASAMKRAGDGDAASALKRATRISVVGGRYVTVRGLGERYAATTLDGGALPSPEPERRVVPLDLFPTGALSGVAVQKTWSPELAGEFGGGAVQLRSLKQPEEPFVSASIGVGARGGTTFSQGPTAPGGALDFLGVDDGTRRLPEALRTASEEHTIAERNALTGEGYTVDELERFGEGLQRLRTPRLTTLPPNASLSLGAGTKLDTPVGELGLVGTTSYGQSSQHTRTERQTLVVGGDGALVPRERGIVEGTERTVAVGALGAASLHAWGHEIGATTLLQRVSDDTARVFSGSSAETQERVRNTRLSWVERTVLSQRLSGAHPLPMLLGLSSSLEWRYAYALGLRHEPDTREVRYDEDPTVSGRMLLSDRPEGNQRLFSDVTDHMHDAGVSWKLPVPIWLEQTATLSAGLAGTLRDRGVDTRRYKFLHKGRKTGEPALRERDVEDIFTPEHIGKDGFLLGETTRPTDNYAGAQRLGAGYLQAELPIAFGLTAAGGARVEAMHMKVSTFELFSASGAPVDAVLDTLDVLPALSLTWAFVDAMQLRGAVSRTVSRPEMRELSPAVFTDVTGGRSRFGNPEVKPAAITHADLRYEWYPAAGEVVGVGLFGKHFQDPIETVITSGADQSITVANADSALSVGLELEARKTLGFVHPWLAPLSVGGNGALIHSQVALPKDGIHTSKERALEGQSPWVGNAQIAWDDDDLGTHAAVLYNLVGPRIVEVGVLGAPDVIEDAQHQLDVVLSQELAWGFTMSVRGTNLMDLPSTRTQGGITVERTPLGRAVFLSLSWKL